LIHFKYIAEAAEAAEGSGGQKKLGKLPGAKSEL
jgi:hypothetical protein